MPGLPRNPRARRAARGIFTALTVAATAIALGEAAAVADRIAVIESGELLQHDTVDRIYNRPSSLAVARLMGGKNWIDGRVHDGAHHSPIGRVEVEAGTPDGPGILVIRHEAIAVAPKSARDPSLGAGEYDDTISAIHRTGPRRSVVITVGAVDVHAELTTGTHVPVGTAVVFTLPHEAVFVVPR